MTHSLKLGLQASVILFASVLTTACNHADDTGLEYAPQMYESIPYEPLRQVNTNTINPMGINERVPVVGTIARGKLNYYSHVPKDSVVIAERTLKNPYAYTKENLEEGKVLYTRICSHCHGEQGDGQGPVGIKFKGVPNYSTGNYKTMNDAHIYHVIQWGRNRMMPHGSIVNPQERWKIAMYVRVLQRGEGPDGLSKLVQTKQDSTQLTDRATQKPVLNAQADKGSETPGQGDKARNGTAE
ncbi:MULTISPECIES: c-type cytochrome [Hymenobacter]|uniref:C-type cytochrome n=1 Tax=Hymenobacter jejuensis TaxID=2502781 RepID=A0A5B8A1V8_9BACT|nr:MULTISPECIES: cytochrome c [Hymenobacter]MBC6990460.1 c-type cytochrome [Hymenobacter sp. BT491]QDA61117.1 c-type cytochrome [Hymenobacter jejuensis]